MLPRPLGATGLSVSPIGLGTVKLGRTAGLKHPEPFRLPSDDEAADLIARARDLGVNLIDTAPAYGSSEERLGTLIGADRDRWIISSKAGERFDAETETSTFDYSAAGVIESVERSLQRLRTDRLDVLLLHSDGGDVERLDDGDLLRALDLLKTAGKVRAVGASTKTRQGALRAVEALDLAMVTLNPRSMIDLPAIELAETLGKGILVKKALLSGHVGEAAGEAPTAAECLRFALGTNGVSSVIVGTVNPDHLVEAVAAATDAEHARG